MFRVCDIHNVHEMYRCRVDNSENPESSPFASSGLVAIKRGAVVSCLHKHSIADLFDAHIPLFKTVPRAKARSSEHDILMGTPWLTSSQDLKSACSI